MSVQDQGYVLIDTFFELLSPRRNCHLRRAIMADVVIIRCEKRYKSVDALMCLHNKCTTHFRFLLHGHGTMNPPWIRHSSPLPLSADKRRLAKTVVLLGICILPMPLHPPLLIAVLHFFYHFSYHSFCHFFCHFLCHFFFDCFLAAPFAPHPFRQLKHGEQRMIFCCILWNRVLVS